MKIFKHYAWDMMSLSVIAAVIGIFFFRFFWPEPLLIVTPEFGRSDAWHSSYSLMAMLSTALRSGSLPTWTPLIGNGIPLDGEVMGTFYPVTFFLFRFLPLSLAYNLLIVISLFVLASGMYVWLRFLGIGRIGALTPSLVLPISGMIIPRLEHIMIIPGLSLLPWIMIATIMLIAHPTKKYAAILSVTVGIQILAAFPQVTFISLLLSFTYYLLTLWGDRQVMHRIILYALAIVLSIGIGSIQLLPSYAYAKNSTISDGFNPSMSSFFAFPPNHFLTFLNPFALGNPKIGTYPDFIKSGGSIFWENSAFVGLVPLILVGITLLMVLRGSFDAKRRTHITVMLCLLVIAALLMLGYHSPLYIIYSFWPFSNFRTPSRFLWMFVFVLLTISAYGADALWKQKTWRRLLRVFLVTAICLNTAHVAWVWWDYHALARTSSWQSPPEVIPFLVPEKRIYTYGFAATYNAEYTTRGFASIDQYDFFRNLLAPNTNVFWNIPHTDAYPGVVLRRSSIVKNLLTEEIRTDEGHRVATPSGIAKKLLDMGAIGSIISTVSFPTTKTLDFIHTFHRNDVSINVYHNPDALARAYFSDDIRVARTVGQAKNALSAPDFIPGKTILAEEQLPIEKKDRGEGTARIVCDTPTVVCIAASHLSHSQILVLADTYYPEWHAFIDGQATRIYPVNINQRGVIVPSGDHTVEMRYDSLYFRLGSIITIFTSVIIIVLVVYPQARVVSGTAGKARR